MKGRHTIGNMNGFLNQYNDSSFPLYFDRQKEIFRDFMDLNWRD